jgi:hypothetical protein
MIPPYLKLFQAAPSSAFCASSPAAPKSPSKDAKITVAGSPPSRVMSRPFEVPSTPVKKRSISPVSENLTVFGSPPSRVMSRPFEGPSTPVKFCNPKAVGSLSSTNSMLGSPPSRMMSRPLEIPSTPVRPSSSKVFGPSSPANFSALESPPSRGSKSRLFGVVPSTPMSSRFKVSVRPPETSRKLGRKLLMEDISCLESAHKRMKIDGREAKPSLNNLQVSPGGTKKPEEAAKPPNFAENARYYDQTSKSLVQALKEKHPETPISYVNERQGDQAAYLGEGDFGNAYLVNWNDQPQVIKIWHFRNSKENDSLNILTREVSHYYQLKQADISVADHYNMDMLANNGEFLKLIENYNENSDPTLNSVATYRQLKKYLSVNFRDGFYRAEYIPDPFFTRKELDEISIDEELFEVKNHPLFQLKEMLRSAYEHGIPIDIRPENLRLKEGILKLIDLQPEDHGEKDWEDDNVFEPLLNQFLAQISKPASILWKYLDPRSISQ